MRSLFEFMGKIVIGTTVGVLTAAAVAAIGLAITDATNVTDVQSVLQADIEVVIPPDLEFRCTEDQSGDTICSRSK